ncbi:MAG: type II CRISPR RNA-guided endonuclease Cas9 [Candidatus Nitrotoga sp.]|nr:type II CRISPR RNA-guided endonuclease Cas9 [Candidatus Nitrotoga sp.]MDP3496380.1 type II CRISPR RNA-guided endonuclease Cas9 [Candidatus Nitrotoga sp.]
MVVKYRLGLDVGTASVGAAAVSLDKDGQPDALIWHHVRIFSEPLENGQAGLVSKKAGRRKARMQRRQIDRRTSRLRHIAHLSSLLNLKREEITPDDGSSLPRLRAQAATERVDLDDLLRIFLRLSKRRGYKGEFKAKKKGEVAEGSGELRIDMRNLATERGIALKDENDTGITLGQYLLHRKESGLPTKLKVKEVSDEPKSKKSNDANAPKNLYALRSMVEHEFNTIWDTQTKYHDILNGTHDGKPIREHFYEALFYQRPLKSAADLVAQCGLEPTLPRAPRAQMAFQRFRIEKTLADLRWGAGKRAEPITSDQKRVIRCLLDRDDKVKFEDIYEALEDAGCAKPQGKGLNLDRASREELLGNSTLAALRKLDRHSAKKHPERAANLEQAFRALDEKTQIATINFLTEIGSPEQLDDSDWHTCFVKSVKDIKVKDSRGKEQWKYKNIPRIFSPELIAFVNRIKEHDNFDRLSKMDFDGGRASYSVKALNNLADWLEEPNWPGDWQDDMKRMDEEAAIRVCYPKSLNREIKRMEKLPAPEATGNAVVDGSLRQIRWTVNKMIAELGAPPDEIVVEMAREMSLGISRRNERESENTKQQKARREAEKEIRTHGKAPTPPNIRRYLLWAEQEKSFCPYCNKTISLAEVLSADTEFEHILPKKLTQVGLKRSEIVLAHYNCNQAKGDRTPWEAWGDGQDNVRWQSVEAAAEKFDAKKNFRKAKLLRLKDYEREVLTDESINGFADSQFHHTSWIAKEATQWLECLCPNKVSVSRGELTSTLRRSWKLETVIPEVRYENKLPVLDTGGKLDDKGKALAPQPIAQDEFASLKKYLEGHPIRSEDRKANPGFDFNRRPDKRLDHRHHLIDAITLALTSRGLFQQMAKNYKAAAERMLPRDGETAEERERRIKTHARLRLEAPEPPLRNVRAAALDAVRECRISFKPDRSTAGRLFQDFVYRVFYMDGDEPARLTRRKSLTELAGDSVEQTLKNINDIANIDIRRTVKNEFEKRIANKAQYPTPKIALTEPIKHHEFGTSIRKVHCFQKIGRGYLGTDGSITISYPKLKPRHEKRLLHDGYACLELKLNAGKFESARSVRKQEAQQAGFLEVLPDVTLYFKGDAVLDKDNGKHYLIRQINDGGKLVIAPITETLGVADMSSDYDLRRPSGKSLIDFTLIKDV